MGWGFSDVAPDHQPMTRAEFNNYNQYTKELRDIDNENTHRFSGDTVRRLEILEQSVQQGTPTWVKVVLPVTAVASVGGLSLAAYQGLNSQKNAMNYSV